MRLPEPLSLGREFVFSLVFPAGAAGAVVAEQMSVIERELRAVRELCESRPSR